ncbi:MAG: carbamoyltransferase [Candidatus Nanoarchaeia archaeon]
MYVLGISCYYHDSAAALLKDGVLVAAAEQERFSRKKHDSTFPLDAINYCLKKEGITVNDLDHIAFYEKPFLKFERLLFQHLDMWPRTLKTFLSSTPAWINERLRVPRIIKKKLKYKGPIMFVQHHLAHAASAFLVSPYEKAAILTIDGVGEWTTTAYGMGEGNQVHLMKDIRFPHSIGLLYSTITAYLGFSVNNSEYKVMGLSPYGLMDREKNPYYKKLLQVVDVKEDGSYKFDMSYFTFHYKDRMPSQKLCDLLGGPVRVGESELTQRHKDISAALQMVTEDIISKILHHVHKVTKCDNIVLAGGCALNSVYNGKILRNTPFKQIWIQPNATDGGTCIGAAAYTYFSVHDKPRNYIQRSAYLGPSFSDKEIKEFFDKNNIKYHKFKNRDELINETAKLIHADQVIGWFQGGMEWGPRALGARSILSNACNPDMQEVLNLKVKHREKFRPFAPVVCADDALTYFDCDNPVPEPTDFMLMVYPVRQVYHDKIPSVTHVDGSGRLQSIRKEQNELYYDLIKEFGKHSGIPILINTSFNIRGEPIVCTPNDAYRCMMGTGIDYLIAGNFIVKRSDNPKDMWDSEELAKD